MRAMSAPVFVLSSARSGSTLTRLILGPLARSLGSAVALARLSAALKERMLEASEGS
jgi:hypothetical protein